MRPSKRKLARLRRANIIEQAFMERITNPMGFVPPTTSELAFRAGCSPRSVSGIIRELVEPVLLKHNYVIVHPHAESDQRWLATYEPGAFLRQELRQERGVVTSTERRVNRWEVICRRFPNNRDYAAELADQQAAHARAVAKVARVERELERLGRSI